MIRYSCNLILGGIISMKKFALFFAVAFLFVLTFSILSDNVKAEEPKLLDSVVEVDELTEVDSSQIVNNDSGFSTMGAGEWDKWFGNPDEKFVTPGYWRTFNTVYSGGGDYKVKINVNETGGKLDLRLYEEDGEKADLVKEIKGATVGKSYVFNVRGWTDGDNEKAELFVNVYSHGSRKDGVSLSYWD